jgi:DNA-directed RNA polymerase specialized sigma24 family protein
MKNKLIDVKRLKKALEGGQVSQNELFKLCEGTIREVFYPKICMLQPEKWKQLPIPDGLPDLCLETFKRAVQKIKKDKIDIKDLHAKCRKMAALVWSELAQSANQGNQEALSKLFFLCRRQMKAKIRRQLGPHSDYIEDLCQDLFLLTCEKIREIPYDEKYPFYTYLNEIVGAKYLAIRLIESGVTTSIKDKKEPPEKQIQKSKKPPKIPIIHIDRREKQLKTYPGDEDSDKKNTIEEKKEPPEKQKQKSKKSSKTRTIYWHPREEHLQAFYGDGNSDGKNALENIPGDKDPEGLVIEAEERKQLLNIKLTALQLCAISSKPHQFIAFGFNKWLGDKTAEVAEECNKKNIGVLSEELFQRTERSATQSYNLISEEQLRSFFSPLNAKIIKRVKQIYLDSEYENVVSEHGSSIIKTLFLIVFAGKKPGQKLLPKNISYWTDGVRKSTFNALNVR